MSEVPEAFQKRIVDLNLRQGDSLLIGELNLGKYYITRLD